MTSLDRDIISIWGTIIETLSRVVWVVVVGVLRIRSLFLICCFGLSVWCGDDWRGPPLASIHLIGFFLSCWFIGGDGEVMGDGALCSSFGSDPGIPNRLITFVDNPHLLFFCFFFSFSLYFYIRYFLLLSIVSGQATNAAPFVPLQLLLLFRPFLNCIMNFNHIL